MSGEIESIDVNGVKQDTFLFPPWKIVAHQSHILHSKCSAPVVCSKQQEDRLDGKCQFCQFQGKLPQLASFPDMTFARNKLSVMKGDSIGIEFNCLDALKGVSEQGPNIEVGAAEAWKEARVNSEASTKKVFKPFDWTFFTDYQGTLVGEISVEDTTEVIDINRLKEKEDILYFECIDLFEDELADHGVAKLDVKIRVMKDFVYILMRYFLRVDHIMTRIQDVRIFHDVKTNYLLREVSRREASLKDPASFPPESITDPNRLSTLLPLITCQTHKLILP